MTRRLPPLLLLGALSLSGCALPMSRQTRYTGSVTPDGACGVAGQGTLTVVNGKFAFTPSDGVILLRGDVGPEGKLAGELAMPGADHKPFVMKLSAQIDGARVSGSYVTPRCRFAVDLGRA